MAGIGELSVSITARTQKARANVTSFRKSIGGLPSVIGRATTSMAGLATAAAGLVSVSAIGNKIKDSFASIDKLAKTSDKLGIATDELTALRFAAEETGAGVDTLDNSLERMIRRVSDAALGSGEAVGALKELGLSASQLNRLSPDEQFKAIAESMGNVSNQADKARLAYDLFGREGVGLLNTLRLGKDGLDQYEETARKLGITVSRFDAAQIEKANDAFGRIGLVVEGLTNKIAIGLAPVVEGVANSITEWGSESQITSKQVTSSLEGVGKAVMFIGRGIEIWPRIFKQAQASAAEFFAFIAKQDQRATQGVLDLLNTITGANLELSGFTKTFAGEMEAAAKKARAEADKTWNQPFSTDGIESFFNTLRDNINASRDALDDALSPSAGLSNLFSMLGGGIGNLTKLGSSMSGASGSGNQPITVKFPPSVEKGSRAEFELLRDRQNSAAQMAAKQHAEKMGIWDRVATGVETLGTFSEAANGLLEDLGDKIENFEGLQGV